MKLYKKQLKINGKTLEEWKGYEGTETVKEFTYEGVPCYVEFEWNDGNPDHINILWEYGIRYQDIPELSKAPEEEKTTIEPSVEKKSFWRRLIGR